MKRPNRPRPDFGWDLPRWLNAPRRGRSEFAERPGWRFSLMLLLQIVFVFIAVPVFGTSDPGRKVIDLLQLATAAAAILLIASGLKTRLGLAFSLALALSGQVLPEYSSRLIVLTAIEAYYLLLAAVLTRAVLGPGRIDQHRIAGAMAIYLYVGQLFAVGFALITVIHPGSLSGLTVGRGHFEDIMHFSLTTMTAIGDPGVAPASSAAKALADLETISGQFFLAAFLARLVGLHLSSTSH